MGLEIYWLLNMFVSALADLIFSERKVGCLHRFFAYFSEICLPPQSFLHQSLNNTSDKAKLVRKSSIMSAPATKFKVADLSLAAFGRKEIELAEVRPAPPFLFARKLIPHC